MSSNKFQQFQSQDDPPISVTELKYSLDYQLLCAASEEVKNKAARL